MRDYTNLDKFLDERVWDAHPNYDYENAANKSVAYNSIGRLFKDFGLEKDQLVLDVGCGDGRDLLEFERLGAEPHGLNFLQIDIDKIPKHIPCWLADQSFMPFGNKSFDCVYSRHCLEHSIMPFFTLCEYNRVLKDDGLCYIELPAPDQIGAQHETNPNHYAVMGSKMWECLFVNSGFKVIEKCVADFWDQTDKANEVLIDKWYLYFLRKQGSPLSGFFRDEEMIKKFSKPVPTKTL